MRKVILNSLIAAFSFLFVPSIHAEVKLPSVDSFKVNGYEAFVMDAKNPGQEKPWVWYAPTLKNYPNNRHAWYFGKLAAKGISIAGIDLGEVRGSHAGNLRFTAFYDEMVRRGFSRQPILLGQSRGGLMMLSWATENPGKLKAFVGIYPVCNLASWPLKNSKVAVIQDYAIPEAELITNLKRYNPIDNLQGLLVYKIPMFIIHGNADEVVPYEENSKLIKDRYELGGGTITVRIVDGGKHEETNAFFECQEVLDFITLQGTAGPPHVITADQTASAAGRSKDQGLKLIGNRFFTLSTIVRVNQIEVSRDRNEGVDESGIHTPDGARKFRETIEKCWPGARISWAFSWLALNDQRQNYKDLRELVVSYHKKYADEITFIPGAYFSPMYNTREQTNRDLHEGLQLVSEMVGGGYRPLAVIGGFMAAENLKYLAKEEGIHVCQGNIWSQYAVDNGDGEGSISYPYYPSREHFCKPAQGKEDQIDCVNLDGWTVDFLMARYPVPRFINGIRCGSRQGVGPIETILRQGIELGTKEILATTAAHFDAGFTLNKFAWITCIWELCLVEGRNAQKGLDGLEIWLNEMRRRWPESKCITHGEFGILWRKQFKNNDSINYRFVQRGSGVCGSEPEMEIRWFMNKDFRLSLLRNWQANSPEKLIDFTRYDLKAHEPDDPKPGQNTRNWSLFNRLNQKGIRPQDKPIDIGQLNAEEQAIVKRRYPELLPDDSKTTHSGGTKTSTGIADNLSKAASMSTTPVVHAFIDDEAPGWRSLTSADFTLVNSADDTWSWKDGVLYCTGHPISVNRTKKEFVNFEMVVEWMHGKPAGNSGVFVWATQTSIDKLTTANKPGLPDGIEVQILDHGFTDLMKAKGAKTDWFGTNGDVFPVRVKMTPFPPLSPDGSRSFPRKHLAKGHGEWNHYYIRAINGEVRLWVNGEEVSGGTAIEPRKGYLCLESEGSPIQFRKLRMRELP